MYINREDTNYNIEVEIFQNQYNQFKSNKIIIPTLFIFFFVEYRLYEWLFHAILFIHTDSFEFIHPGKKFWRREKYARRIKRNG